VAKSGVAFLKSHLLHGYTYVAGFVAKCNDATKFSSLQSQLRQVLRFAGRGGYLLKSRPKFVANENVAIQIATFSFATKKFPPEISFRSALHCRNLVHPSVFFK